MLWFALGLLIGNFLGMLLLGVFMSRKRTEWMYDHDKTLYDYSADHTEKKRMSDCLTAD